MRARFASRHAGGTSSRKRNFGNVNELSRSRERRAVEDAPSRSGSEGAADRAHRRWGDLRPAIAIIEREVAALIDWRPVAARSVRFGLAAEASCAAAAGGPAQPVKPLQTPCGSVVGTRPPS